MRKIQLLLVIFFVIFQSTFVYSQTLHLVTENYPPFNMSKDGSPTVNNEEGITGISTDIVKTLFDRAGIDYTMVLYPWKRAYDMALKKKDYGVFSTTLTPERKDLFKWVGPIVMNDWVFLAKKSQKIKINNIEEAKKYHVGGYSGDATAIFLENHGFKLQLAKLDSLNAKKLDKGRIDLWATGRLLGAHFAKEEGVGGFEEVFAFKKVMMSLALNKDTSDVIVDKLNKTLQAMVDDGTVEAIHQRYQ